MARASRRSTGRRRRALWPELARRARRRSRDASRPTRATALYLERQATEIAAFRADEALALRDDVDFAAIPGLSTEMVERLTAARPATFGAAARFAGVTPGALGALLAHVRRAA